MRQARRPQTLIAFVLIAGALVCGWLVGSRLSEGWQDAFSLPTPLSISDAESNPRPPPLTPLATIVQTLPVRDSAVAGTAAGGGSVSITPASAPQVHWLILGVDSLDSPAPRLQALWIAALDAGLKRVYLLPLSPGLWVTPDGQDGMRLAEAFARDPGTGTGGPLFEAALAAIPHPPLSGTLVLDAPLLAQWVDRLGGVRLGDSLMNGEAALDYLTAASADDPIGQLNRQGEFLNALGRSADSSNLSDPLPFLEVFLSRGRTTLAPEALRATAEAFRGLSLADVVIAPRPGDGLSAIVGPDGLPAVVIGGLAATP